MKKIPLLLFTLAIISATTFSQEKQNEWFSKFTLDQKKVNERDLHNFNFDNENKKIYWQKVYENGSYDDVKKLIVDMGCIINHDDSTMMSGSTPMNNLRMPKGTKKYYEDYYGGGTSRYIYFEPCTIYFSIDIKNDKYRVTVTNMIWEVKTSVVIFGVIINSGNVDINKILIRQNGKLRSGVGYKDDFSFLNECLDMVFNIKKNNINIKNDNW